MTRTTPLERLLSLIDDQDPTPRPIPLLSAAEIGALSESLRPLLRELAVAELTEVGAGRLARYGQREGATFLLQLADAIPALPRLDAALRVDPKELVALSELLVRLAALERALALCHEGADTALLHALAVADGHVRATLDALQAVLGAVQVPEPLRALFVGQRDRAEPAAADGDDRDDAPGIKDFVAAVRAGQVATMALPPRAKRTSKARRARGQREERS